jgi:DNA repair protein RadD
MKLLKHSIMGGHKRPMVQAPTGAGKTLLATHIVAGALGKGNRVTFVVPAVELIDQTVQAFYAEGIKDVGVIQSDHHLTDYSKPVQVASVQTITKRDYPDTDVVVVDEAHRAFKAIFEWMKAKPGMIFIGLSATPWTKGLGKHYDDLIIAATTQELIDAGYLSPFRVFAPSHPDLTGVRTSKGDYHEGDLGDAMDKPELTADVVETWLKLGDNRQTLCFAVNRAHAKNLQRKFESVGVATGYVDAFTDRFERAEIRRAFEAGRIRVVCNVGVLTTGVDWDVRCLVLARPTKSEMLYTQIIGRALRMAEGKRDAIILDHSDTTLRLGFVTDIQHDCLDEGREKKHGSKDQEKAPSLPKECTSCAFLKPAKVHACPNCGFAPEKQADIEVADGELTELSGKAKAKKNKEATWEEKINFIGQLRYLARERNRTDGWVAHAYKDKFGVWPNDPKVKYAPETLGVSEQVRNWVKAKDIRFAKRRAKEQKQAEASHAA